ncbi:hypothetical protein [Conexibacter sp. CPCC 206217]|uniref:hypothetical protein n=1 Tax=Conexibacter sp. CPCC 206217 TaxID=3064574 RepID=UPI0027229B1E|nr:hypothetical protein [Conexibacter sp. CPCC 206217]MDO8209099.1 hypothetical protein [Conexibacter sp. CPCC 206217]
MRTPLRRLPCRALVVALASAVALLCGSSASALASERPAGGRWAVYAHEHAARASAAAGAVSLSTVAARPVKIAGAGAATGYTSAESVWVECRGGAMPLMMGWSGTRAAIATIYSNNLLSARTLGVAVRRPLVGGVLRATALCARGPIAARTQESSSGTVSCNAGQLAIGVPIDGGPYWTRAIASMPVGTRGWRNTEGGYARAKVICVAASAFRAVHVVTKRASLPAGARTATVTAECRGATRPVSWGFEAGLLEGNTWRSPDSDLSISVPFVATAKASGRAGWSLTFATPDGKPAASATPIGLGVTCAAPR